LAALIMSDAALQRIKDLNVEYSALTGSDAYLYASQPATVTLYTFVTAPRPFANSGDALAHMQDVIGKARAGWTHEEIIYGRNRREITPDTDPYPNAHRVNRGAW
jgi:hypothetical protein